MGWFKSREERERQEALKSSQRVAQAVGLNMVDVLGAEVHTKLYFRVGALLQHADRGEWVYVKDDLDIAAVTLLVMAGLLKRWHNLPGYLDITPKGREVARGVFHLK